MKILSFKWLFIIIVFNIRLQETHSLLDTNYFSCSIICMILMRLNCVYISGQLNVKALGYSLVYEIEFTIVR